MVGQEAGSQRSEAGAQTLLHLLANNSELLWNAGIQYSFRLSDFTVLEQMELGDSRAADELLPLVYDERCKLTAQAVVPASGHPKIKEVFVDGKPYAKAMNNEAQ